MVPVLLDLFPYFILLSLFSVNPLQSEYRNFFFFFRLEWLSFYSWNNFHSHFRCFKYRWIRMMTSRIYLLSRKGQLIMWLELLKQSYFYCNVYWSDVSQFTSIQDASHLLWYTCYKDGGTTVLLALVQVHSTSRVWVMNWRNRDNSLFPRVFGSSTELHKRIH